MSSNDTQALQTRFNQLKKPKTLTATNTKTICTSGATLGVRRLFSREGKIFQGGGGGQQKHTICRKSTKKDTIF